MTRTPPLTLQDLERLAARARGRGLAVAYAELLAAIAATARGRPVARQLADAVELAAQRLADAAGLDADGQEPLPDEDPDEADPDEDHEHHAEQ